jgi:hypothetical protein
VSAANGGMGIRGRKIESCRDGIKILPKNMPRSFLILEGGAILGAPNASRDRVILTDNALQREVSFTVEETLISVRCILKNLYLAARLECATPVAPLERPLY